MLPIDDLLARLTLDEKARLCAGADFWSTPAVERLEIPSITLSDGPHGLRVPSGDDHLGLTESRPATCFPSAAGLAGAWDPALARAVGEALGVEARAMNLQVVLGPGANIKRSPLCGRNFEYFSEDPLLSATLAAAHIQGVQSCGVGASLKHFAANNQEHRRMSVDAIIDERPLREIYLASFEHAVIEARPFTVMCAYNRVNGTYCAENRRLLTDILRNEWGFDGLVVSDWGAVDERLPALEAGLDLEMPPADAARTERLASAVEAGALDETVLDSAVKRLLPLIQRTRATADAPAQDVESQPFEAAHHRLARRVARESMVLLKNEHDLLPLESDTRIALIGEFADRPRYQGGGSSHVNATRVTSLRQALSAQRPLDTPWARGFDSEAQARAPALEEEAVALARDADVAVLCLGVPEHLESEGFDRPHLDLPDNQRALIEAVAAVNSRLVVVLASGAPVVMPWIERAGAVLQGYLGGQAVGEAQADLLLGEASPCGRLAESYPVRLEDTPCYLHFPGEGDRVHYNEGIHVGYRYYDSADVAPLFPFGHGLGYTRFAYHALELSHSHYDGDGALTVSLAITNKGGCTAKEVVQLYLHDATGCVPVAEQALRGFEKLELAPGETQRVTLSLKRRDFCYYDTARCRWRMPSGRFEVRLGASSQDIRLRADLEVTGEAAAPAIDRNTLLGDLLDDERALPVLREHLADYADELPMLAPLAGQKSDDPMMAAMSRYLPLRAIVSFSSFSEAELDRLLEALRRAGA